jgi:adenosylhomocysteine nucleosidase
LNLQEVDLGCLFALAIEAGCFVDMLSDVRVTRGDGFVARQGRYGNHQIVVVESGPGAKRAAKAAHAMIDAYRPRLVVSAGFAGGLDPKLRRQDLVVATSLIRLPSPSRREAEDEGGELALDPAALVTWLADVQDLHLGRLLTVDQIVRLREVKLQLGGKYDAIAVDMETFAVAQVCRQRTIDFLSVRAISDAADDELPADIGKLLAQKSFAGRFGAALGSIFRRPASVKDLFNLHQSALAGSSRLARFLGTLIERIR